MQAKPPLQRQIEQKLQQSPEEQKSRLITPHPDYEVYTPGQLTEDMARVKAEIAQADAVHDRELVSWLRCELSLNFAAQRSWRMKEEAVEKRNGARVEPNGNRPAQEDFWPKPMTMAELDALDVETGNWIWGEAIPFGEVAMLVAEPRCGKTTLALNLCLAISRGVPFLGRPTKQSSCLYVSLDNSTRDMKLLKNQLGITNSDSIFVHIGKIPDQRNRWLLDTMRETGAQFVVVDTLERYYEKTDINKPDMAKAMVELDFEIKKREASLLYSHHATAKPSILSRTGALFMGHTTVKAMTPYYLEMVRKGEQNTYRILRSDLRSGRNIEDMYVELDPKTKWSKNAGTLIDALRAEKKIALLEFITQSPGKTEKEIREEITGTWQVMARAIRELLDEGKVERTGRGGKNEPFRYYPAGQLPEILGPKVVELFPEKD